MTRLDYALRFEDLLDEVISVLDGKDAQKWMYDVRERINETLDDGDDND